MVAIFATLIIDWIIKLQKMSQKNLPQTFIFAKVYVLKVGIVKVST